MPTGISPLRARGSYAQSAKRKSALLELHMINASGITEISLEFRLRSRAEP